ncbi:MAG: phospholipase [Chitinophagaceae bacterium]|nr:phospholipase [Chitinophagaceae bacterium]
MKGYTRHNKIKLVFGGAAFFKAFKEMIDCAKESVHLQTYIFDCDKTGTEVADALIAAAKRGLKVYVLADGFASKDLPEEFIQNMQNAGVQFRFFEPILSSNSFYFGRRLHHKILVTDGLCGMVGGRNITDRYNDMPDEKAWFDLGLYTEGEVSVQLYKTCWALWEKKPSRRFKLSPEMTERLKKLSDLKETFVRVRRNDWVKRKNEIWKTYLELLLHAKDSVTIMSSYFLPGVLFRMAIKRALRRGVKIRVIVAGLSDVKIAKHAERYLYRWMLRNKIQVYEYQPTVLHAKMGIADEDLFTVGSYNVNDLSAYASIEANLDVKDRQFCKQMKEELEKIIAKDCIHINEKTYTTSLISLRQLMQWTSFNLLRAMLFASTFYYKQRE